ncbi:hypothetical protein [Desulfuromusa kysingii]|uniref:hypothetical protein n=1 Tax=Desulfuromusa kysingii TaxID=37625 RepID=UPI000B811628|nr:hypothetical protein [Desulfuromusa kysingii]
MNNGQGHGVATPPDAILFCRTTNEYAEKGAQLLARDIAGSLHSTTALRSGKTRAEALKHLPL